MRASISVATHERGRARQPGGRLGLAFDAVVPSGERDTPLRARARTCWHVVLIRHLFVKLHLVLHHVGLRDEADRGLQQVGVFENIDLLVLLTNVLHERNDKVLVEELSHDRGVDVRCCRASHEGRGVRYEGGADGGAEAGEAVEKGRGSVLRLTRFIGCRSF